MNGGCRRPDELRRHRPASHGSDREIRRRALDGRAVVFGTRGSSSRCRTRTCSKSTPRRTCPWPLGLCRGWTTIFNMIVNPANGHLYVSNTDARNERRFRRGRPFSATIRRKTVRGVLAIADHHRRQSCPPRISTSISIARSRSLRFPTGRTAGGSRSRWTWRSRTTETPVRGGVWLEQGRGVQHQAARTRHLRSGRGEPDPCVRRRAGRSGARRGRTMSLRADAVQQ